MYQASFNNRIAMATVDAPWDKLVFKIKTYKYTLKVAKFHLPATYHFRKQREKQVCRWIPPPPPGLFRALNNYARFPLDCNGIVKSCTPRNFQLTVRRFLRIYDKNLLGCKSEAFSVRFLFSVLINLCTICHTTPLCLHSQSV